MRFKILRGIHTQREPVKDKTKCDRCNGTGKVEVPRKKGEWECPSCLGTGIRHEVATYDSRDPARSILRSEIDLEARFGSEKFQNLDRLTATADNQALLDKLAALERENQELKTKLEDPVGDRPEEPGFEEMSSKQLREFARKEGIDVTTASSKEEIINILRSVVDVR
jgi:hypothetical protein